METFDVVVIGGGSAGEVAAGRLSDGGLSVAIVERDLFGGECTYWACMPAKALLRPGNVLAEAREVEGASDAVGDSVDAAGVLGLRTRLASGYEDDAQVRWLERHGVEVIRGEARMTGERTISVDSGQGSRDLTAERAVILATGSDAIMIGGSSEVDVWGSRELTSAERPPESLLIAGGGAVGTEMAQAWHDLGTEVVLVEAEDHLLPGEEPFAGEQLAESFADRGISVQVGVTVEDVSAKEDRVRVELSDGESVETQRFASAVGRSPGSGEELVAGTDLEPGEFVEVDPQMRTRAHPGWLYAIGDVNGRHLLTHMGKAQARVAADHILGHDVSIGLSEEAVPRVVFTRPVIAATGVTEGAARSEGRYVQTRRAEFGRLGQGSVWGEDTGGIAQIVLEGDLLVGATLTGPSPVAEMIFAFQMAIIAGIHVDTLRKVVPQYPTFSEIWSELLDV